jgi:ferredoxin-NADP reductase
MAEWSVRYLGSRVRATATKTFTFERPTDLKYRAGQFFFVLLGPTEAFPHSIEHHFSFSSSPTEPNVEFTTRMTASEFKNRVDGLAEGDLVHIAGPDGAFVLEPRMRKVVFISAGIGVTPARSIVRWALDSKADVDITLLYGNRNLEATAFREEFDAIESEKVRVVNVLSEPDEDWSGPRGRIDADLVREYVPDWKERDFLVSGPPVVVSSLAGMLLRDVGIDRPRLMTEHFPGYGYEVY